MRIIINESQEKYLIAALLKESEGEQNLIIFDFLDKNFVRADYTQEDNGTLADVDTVVWLDSKKQPYKTITTDRLFYMLQDKFSNLTSDREERDMRLKNIIDAWINKKYNPQTGNLLS